jgi:DNA polymerase-1
MLADSEVPKVGYDLKRQVVGLSRLGVDLIGVQFDPLIAGHLLDAGQRNQGLADLLDRCRFGIGKYSGYSINC